MAYSSRNKPSDYDKTFMRWVYFFAILASTITILIICNVYGPKKSPAEDPTPSWEEVYSKSPTSSSTSTNSSSTNQTPTNSTSKEPTQTTTKPNSTTPTNSSTQTQTSTTPAPAKPSIKSQKTASGLSYGTALNLCVARLENKYGYELNSVDEEEIRGDSWYFELEGLYETSYYWSINVAKCTVSGPESSPRITSFSEDEYDRGTFTDDGDYYSDDGYYY